MQYVSPYSDLSLYFGDPYDFVFTVVIPENWKTHYLHSRTCAVYFCNPRLKVHTVVPIDMVDEESVERFSIPPTIVAHDKRLAERWLIHPTVYDINTVLWLEGERELPKVRDNHNYKALIRHYGEFPDPNRYIPSLKHLEYCYELIKPGLDFLIDKESLIPVRGRNAFYNNTVYPAITAIERAGIQVDEEKFYKAFGKRLGERVFCHYNLHTSTGRPSNTWNNINYAALKKDSLERECIISRFDYGRLVEYDFDAYHVRIIGSLMNYDFADESVHKLLGREYFKKEEINEEEYEESKHITFHNLYGTIPDEYKNIDFFKKVELLKDKMWKRYEIQGFVKSPISKSIIVGEDMNKNKLFNYYLQMVETDFSMIIINELVDLLQDYSSKLILYTYDSFLIDFNQEDGDELLEKVEDILNRDGMMAKKKVGVNYRNMVNEY